MIRFNFMSFLEPFDFTVIVDGVKKFFSDLALEHRIRAARSQNLSPRTHKVSKHFIQWTNFSKGRVVGWVSTRPVVGDLLVSEMESGRTAEFIFLDVEHMNDPSDMFFGTVQFTRYLSDDDLAKVVISKSIFL